MGEALGDDEYMTDIHRGASGFGFNIKGALYVCAGMRRAVGLRMWSACSRALDPAPRKRDTQ